MKKKNKKLNIFKLLDIITAVSMAIALIVGIVLTVKVLKFASVLPQIIYSVVIILFCVLLLILISSVLSLIYNKNHVIRGISYFLTLLLIIGGLYGTSVLGRVSKNIDKITNPGNMAQKKVAVFVTYNNTDILSIDDIANCRFGIIDNNLSHEGRLMPMAELKDKKIDVQYVEFETYKDMLDALYIGDIDVAALPSSFRSLISYSEPVDEDIEGVEEEENENSEEQLSFASAEELEEVLNSMAVIYEYEHEIKEEIASANTNIDVLKDPFSVLLLGTADGLSDTMILATFNPVNFTVTMTSIARDSYVPIACYSGGGKDKINAARSLGIQCAIDTVENLTGVEIDFYVETNFQGIVDIVNAMGGVVLDVPFEFVGQDPGDIRGNYTVWVPAGENNLNGEQVLAFARERYKFADGDFSRQSNQQKVIWAIANKLLNTRDINTILDVLDAAGNNVSTNMPMDKIVSLLTYSVNVINYSYGKDATVLDMKTSRFTGVNDTWYPSFAPSGLYIYKIYNSSIQQNVALINRNLQKDKTLKGIGNFEFNIIYPYFREPLYTVSFAEVNEREKPKDVLANYVGKELKVLEEWCKEKEIELKVVYVYEGDEDWDEELADGIILSQSVKAGTSLDEVTSITVTVNRNEKIVDFKDKTLDELIQWAVEKEIRVDLDTGAIAQDDKRWSFDKVGLIVKQTYDAKENTIIPTYYDYLRFDASKIINKVDKVTFEAQLKKYGFTNVVFKELSSEVSTTGNPGDIVVIQVGGVTRTSSFELRNNSNTYQMTVTYLPEDPLKGKDTMVTFADETNGWTAWGQKAKIGDKLVLPTAPEKDGFKFRDWTYNGQSYQAGDMVEITKIGTTFTAHYSKDDNKDDNKTYTVTFLDHNGNVLAVYDKVKSGSNVTAPSAPKGYAYTWNTSDLENIKANKTIKPAGVSCADGYIDNGYGCEIKSQISFTVKFYDAYNGVISEQSIIQGSAAIAPGAPSKDKYQFTGWDTDFSNVQSSLDIHPVFGACSDPNGDINNGCEVPSVDPEQPEISSGEESSDNS